MFWGGKFCSHLRYKEGESQKEQSRNGQPGKRVTKNKDEFQLENLASKWLCQQNAQSDR